MQSIPRLDVRLEETPFHRQPALPSDFLHRVDGLPQRSVAWPRTWEPARPPSAATTLHRGRMNHAVHAGTRQVRRLVRRMHSGAADSPVIMPLSSWMMRIALTRSGLAAAMAPQAPSLALPVTAVGGAAEETISINASRLAAAFVWLIAINASRRRAPRRRNFGFQRRLYPL